MSLRNGTPVIKYVGVIRSESAKAILFISDYQGDGLEGIWWPISQVLEIHRTHSIVNDTLDSIIVSRWIAKTKGLIDEDS